MPKLHIVVSEDLLSSFKVAAEKREQTVSSQVRVLMRDFVTANAPKPPTLAEQRAAEKARIAANSAASDARTKQRWTELLESGTAPNEDSIRTGYIHFSTPKEIAEYDALLSEVIRDLRAKGWTPAY